MILRRRLAALMLLLSMLAGCGGGGGGSGASVAPPVGKVDTQAPTARIVFPLTASATEASSVIVRGTASDDGAVSSVRVNGVMATSTNGTFATWQATVPLVPGKNTLTVDVMDSAAHHNAAAAQAIVTRTAMLPQPSSLTLDAADNRLIVFDSLTKSLAAIDLDTGLRFVLSSAPIAANTGAIRLDDVSGMVVDDVNHRVLAVDAGNPGIVAVDLQTGVRTAFTSRDDANALQSPQDIALDATHGRALVVDNALNAVIAVNLADGSRTILSGATQPDDVNPFSSVVSIAVDAAHNRALVVDATLDALVAVDLDSGARSILSDVTASGTMTAFSDVFDIAIDTAGQRALLTNSSLGTVVAVNLADGTRTVLTGSSTPGALESFLPFDIAIDASRGRVLVISDPDDEKGAIVAVDLTNGAQTVLPEDPSRPIDVPFGTPTDVAFDAANNRLLVLDGELNRVVAVNFGAGGQRSILANLPSPPPGGMVSEAAPFGIALDTGNNRALVTDVSQGTITAVDLTTGATSVLLTGTDPTKVLAGIAVDNGNRRAFFIDALSASVFTASLQDPAVFSPSLLASLPQQTTPARLAVDTVANRVLVTTGAGVQAINLRDGSSKALGGSTEANAVLSGIFVEPATNNALVADPGTRSLLVFSLIDGKSAAFSRGGGPNPYVDPQGMAFDADNRRIFIADGQGFIVVIDRSNGQRVFF